MIPAFFRRRREYSYLPLLDWIAVVIGILLFTIAAAPNLVQSSAYFDEGYTAYLANLDIVSMAKYTAQDVHPPLYYATLHVWQGIVGSGLTELRFLSVVFGWVAIVFGFLIIRRYFGWRAGWLAILLMAISPLFVRYGGAMRMYTMALAIAFAATYVLLRAVTSQTRWPWVIYMLLVAVGVWTNYFMVLVWVTHALWVAYEYRSDRKIIQKWCWAILGALILFLPWLPLLITRFTDIQQNGFWIKPVSVDSFVSAVTETFVFRPSFQTNSWLAIGLIVLLIALVLTGKNVYKRLAKIQQPVYRLLIAMSSLPVLLLIVGSLPPFKSSFAYRYVLVAAVSSMLLIAVTISYARFKKHGQLFGFLLCVVTIGILVSGTVHVTAQGNRNLDTNVQYKLGQTMHDIFSSGKPAPIVVRSPYSYYAARLYTSPGYDVHFIRNDDLARVGSTKPLADHPQSGIKNFDGYKRVWMVGEDIRSVSRPGQGRWELKDWVVEYDDETSRVAAAAAYYERID